jgi:glycosyltransferase involved in cell wall biosynthesis
MKKIKVVRVVTASYVVPFHLANTVKRMSEDFEVCVVGQGVSLFQEKFPHVKWVDINIDRKLNPVKDLLALINLCRFLLIYKPDIIHSIMPKAGLLSAFAGLFCRIPVRIHTFTGQVWATKSGLTRMLHYLADKLINVLNTICLTDSPSQSAFLHEHKITNAGQPLPVLLKGSLSGVDITRFNNQFLVNEANQLRESLKLKKSDFVFAFIARKSRDKGAIDVLNAFAQVVNIKPNAKLLFVGPDESDGEIEQLRNKTPDMFNSIFEFDLVYNHEVYLAATNILCLPSYREGFGSIVIDAAALGVPTIGSNISGLRDAIEDGITGQLFPPGDVSALVKIMLGAIENPNKYNKMGLEAIARVNANFTADLLYNALKAFYQQLVIGIISQEDKKMME